MPRDQYFIYIVASLSRRLYVGCTSQLIKRVWQHRDGVVPGFTRRYRIYRLVYSEETRDPREAVRRERQLKRWSRAKKIELIESVNPGWLDLASDSLPPPTTDHGAIQPDPYPAAPRDDRTWR